MTPLSANANGYATYGSDKYPRFSYVFDNRIDPQVLGRKDRVWFGSNDYIQAERDCINFIREVSMGARVWVVQQWYEGAPICLRRMVQGDDVQGLAVVVDPLRWNEDHVRAQPPGMRDALRSALSRFNPKETPMSPSSLTPSTFSSDTMAQQLREWADALDSMGATREGRLRGILVGMREVANDLSPSSVFDRVVTFTRHWCDDWEVVVSRFTAGVGPKEAWTDQVRAEVEDALPGDAKLAWERVEIEGEGGAERLVVRARLRFEYHAADFAEHTDAEVLLQLLYAEGGVCGEFQLVDGGVR